MQTISLLFVPNTECAKHGFHLLDESCSGLKVNYTKTEVILIVSSRDSTAAPMGLTWRKSFKALGIVFTYDASVQM